MSLIKVSISPARFLSHYTIIIIYIVTNSKTPGQGSNLQKVTNEYVDWFMNNSNVPLPTQNLFNNIKQD